MGYLVKLFDSIKYCFKDKKITNILKSIQSSKNCEFSNFIDAISIDGVGEKTSKDLAKYSRKIAKIHEKNNKDIVRNVKNNCIEDTRNF